jgi:hypothetical protein
MMISQVRDFPTFFQVRDFPSLKPRIVLVVEWLGMSTLLTFTDVLIRSCWFTMASFTHGWSKPNLEML